MRFMRGDGPLPWGPEDVGWVLKEAIPLWKTCQQVNWSQTASQVSTERSCAWEYPFGHHKRCQNWLAVVGLVNLQYQLLKEFVFFNNQLSRGRCMS